MFAARSRKPADDRRDHSRTMDEGRATTLIQAILRDETRAANDLENDLRSGGDAQVVKALLAAAESLASLRGMDLGVQIASVRRHLKRAGFTI
jgi:hypothetical protein